MNKIKIVIFFNVFLFVINVFAQDVHYSLYQETKSYFNPAFVAHQNMASSLQVQYRTQWMAIPDAYQTYSINYTRNNPNNSIAWGLMAYQHQAGDASIKSTGLSFNMAYNFTIDQDNLAIGVAIGSLNKHFNPNTFTFDSQYNELTGFDETIASGEVFAQTNRSRADLGLGVHWQSQFDWFTEVKTNVGFALAHIQQPKESFYNDFFKIPIKKVLQAELAFDVYPDICLIPHILWQQQSGYREIVVGARSCYNFNENNELVLGVGYRLNDALMAQIGLKHKKHTIYFAYDNNSSSLKTATNTQGAFEVSWNVNLSKPPKVVLPDTDGDGIVDPEDACPFKYGVLALQGCPSCEIIDTDGDGIIDSLDYCPYEPGLLELKGCNDNDKDGVINPDDGCPNLFGVASNHGCPLKSIDSDKDGVVDELDHCVYLKGLPTFNGCPDSDSDGLSDITDACPFVKGPISNRGCPEATQDKTVPSKMSLVVYFNTDLYYLSLENQIEIDRFVEQLNNRGKLQYHLIIEGHTDNEGSTAYNYQLAQRRASAVQAYLLEKGIALNQMHTIAYGESKPNSQNNTIEGKTKNRRAVIQIIW